MPVDQSDYTPADERPERDGCFVPGYWQKIQQRLMQDMTKGDPRLMDLETGAIPVPDNDPAALALADMDATGDVVTWPPPNADCKKLGFDAEWLVGPGRPRWVRVFDNDWVEDAPEGPTRTDK
jgi:hypothetical protein